MLHPLVSCNRVLSAEASPAEQYRDLSTRMRMMVEG